MNKREEKIRLHINRAIYRYPVDIANANKWWNEYAMFLEEAGNYSLAAVADRIADGYHKRALCFFRGRELKNKYL